MNNSPEPQPLQPVPVALDEQYALSVIYRDAFAVLAVIGWTPEQAAGPSASR
jgi:hypothetical protein